MLISSLLFHLSLLPKLHPNATLTASHQQERRQLKHALTLSLSKKFLKRQGKGGGGAGGMTKKQKMKKDHVNSRKQPAAAGVTLYTCPYCAERFANKGHFTNHVGKECSQRHDTMAMATPMDIDIDNFDALPLHEHVPPRVPPCNNPPSRSRANASQRNLEVPIPDHQSMAMPMDADPSS